MVAGHFLLQSSWTYTQVAPRASVGRVFSHVCFWKEAGKEGWVGERLEYLFLVFLGGCSLKGRS